MGEELHCYLRHIMEFFTVTLGWLRSICAGTSYSTTGAVLSFPSIIPSIVIVIVRELSGISSKHITRKTCTPGGNS